MVLVCASQATVNLIFAISISAQGSLWPGPVSQTLPCFSAAKKEVGARSPICGRWAICAGAGKARAKAATDKAKSRKYGEDFMVMTAPFPQPIVAPGGRQEITHTSKGKNFGVMVGGQRRSGAPVCAPRRCNGAGR